MKTVSLYERFEIRIFPDRCSLKAVQCERILKKENLSFFHNPEPDLDRKIGKDADIDLFSSVTEKFHPDSIHGIFFGNNAEIHI